MSVLNQAISDSYLLGAILLRLLLFVVLDDSLSDGYHVVPRERIRDWEEFHVLLVTIPEAYILSWITSTLTQSGQTVVPWLQVDLWTLTLGLLLSVRWVIPWFRSLQNTDTTNVPSIARVSGFYTSILFGLGFGIAIAVGTHPDPQTLQFLYQRHINFALNILDQFQALLGLQIPVIQPLIDHTVGIYINNGMLAIKTGLLGAIGGLLFGLAIPIILIMGVNAAVLFGVFTGLLIRNTILAGQPLTAAPIAYLSSMGLLAIGHTFHEFMAILLVGVGAGFVTFGFVKSRFESSKAGAKIVAIGFGQLAFAAFIEVWLDPRFINFVKGYVTLDPTISPLSVKSSWALGLGSVIVTTIALVYLTAWMIRTTVGVIEDL